MNKNGLLKAVDSVLGKTFAPSLTKGYVAKWGPIEAIRELTQNALDSDYPRRNFICSLAEFIRAVTL